MTYSFRVLKRRALVNSLVPYNGSAQIRIHSMSSVVSQEIRNSAISIGISKSLHRAPKAFTAKMYKSDFSSVDVSFIPISHHLLKG